MIPVEKIEQTKARAKYMIIIGHTTPTTAKIWAKVPNAGSWLVILSTKLISCDPSDGKHICQNHKFEDENGLNYCFEFTGVKPRSGYYWI